LRIAIRSASWNASCWSWVTKTVVSRIPAITGDTENGRAIKVTSAP